MCRKALKIFKAPDQKSRTAMHEGRKIEEVAGVGWRVLNHFYYRDGMEDMRAKWRRQKKEQRAKKPEGPMGGERVFEKRMGEGASEGELDKLTDGL
jgi:hypothetical protein